MFDRLTVVPVLSLFTLVLFPGTGVTGSRDAAQWPFSVNSPWNMPLGSGAQFESGTAPCSADLTSPTVSTWANAGDWSHPVYVAASADAYNKIRVRGGATVATIRVPSSAKPALPSYSSGGDAHMHVVDPTKHWVDEMWQAVRTTSKSTITVSSYARNDLYGSGVGAGGERAYGGSAIGGLIRIAELQVGLIPHGLAFAIPREKQHVGPVWPAIYEDDRAATTYHGNVHMGTLVGIPPSVNINSLGLSVGGLAVARALQNYGAYDVDSSSDFTLYAEPSAESLLDDVRTDLPRIRAQLRCITNNSPTNVGGGGTPRAPFAPPLP